MKRLYFIFGLILTLLAATGLQAQTLGVDRSTLVFSAQVNGPAVSQTVHLTTTSGTINFALLSVLPSWLKVTPTAGTAPSDLTVTADPTGFLPGNYGAQFTIFGGNQSNVTVNVTLAVGSLSLNPGSLSFSYQTGATPPASQNLNLTFAQGTSVSLSAATTSGGNWLLVSPTSGTSSFAAAVSVNPAVLSTLASGTYNGTITVTPSAGTAVNVPVTLTVSPTPPVTVSPTAVSLGYQIGGSNNSAQQTITISTTGTQGVPFTLTPTADFNPSGRVWFTVSPSQSGTIPANGNIQVTVAYDTTASLPAGTYTGRITLNSGGTPNPIVINVTLLVSNSPLLNAPTGSLNFSYQTGTALPAPQNVTVSSTSGQLPLTISAATTSGGSWLSAPATGTSGTAFSVNVNPTGLAPATYNGTITVSSPQAGNPALQIPVTLVVTNNPVIVISANGCSTAVNQSCPLTFAFQPGQANPATQTLKISSSTGTPLNFNAFANTPSCGGAWLGALNVNGTTDTTLQVSANPAGIAAGSKCDATIAITATNAATGEKVPNSPLNIPVTFYVSSTPLLVANQNAFNFVAQQGGSQPPAQSVALTSTSSTDQLTYTTSFTTNSGGNNWLLVGPQTGTTASGSNIVTVAVLPGLLSAQAQPYSGTITITATGPGGAAVADSPITIPVTLQVTAGTMTVSPSTLSFSQPVGGSAPAAQTISVASSNQQLSYTVSAQQQTTSGGINWLTATPASGSTPGTITVTADGSKLPAGTYTGTVMVTSTTASTGGSPANIPVTLTVTAGTISSTTTSLTFAQAVGGTQPPTQTVAIAATPGPINITVTTSTDNGGNNWLSATPASGTAPGNITVTANGGSLPLGQYTGKVTITAAPPGATGSPIVIPVTFNVVTGQTLSVSPNNLSFAYALGASNPTAQTVQVSATGGAAPFTTQATTASGGSWLSVSPTSGNTPATLTVTANPSNLTAGTYSGTITVSSPNSVSPTTISVSLVVAAVPKPVVNLVGNAGSYVAGGVSPGENIVIFGTGIGPATLAAGTLTPSGGFSTTTGNTQVTFDGTPAPIIYASATQTSVMVPYGVFGRTSTVIRVTYLGVQSDPLTYNVLLAAPGIYTLNQQGNGPGAIINQNNTVNGPGNAAPKNSVVAIYMTGEGATDSIPQDGAIATSLFHPRLPVSATVGGVSATVEYAGSAPGIVYGVMQVNVRIPADAPSGAQPIVVTFGNNTTGTFSTQGGVTVQVQ